MADLNQVFSLLEPYRVLAALAMPISTQSGTGQFVLNGHTYWFDRTKVVALDSQAPFVAGDIVDFVTHRMGLSEGMQWLITRFREQLPQHLPIDLPTLMRQADRRQRHLKAVLRLGDNLSLHPNSFPEAMLWLRHHRLDRAAITRALYAAKGKELNALKVCIDMDKGRPLPDTKTYIVIPYFGDWDSVAALRVEPADGSTDAQWWELNLTTHAWLGLQAGSPKAAQRVIHGDWLETLKHINHNHGHQGPDQHLQVRQFTADRVGRKLTSAAVAETDRLGARTTIQMSRLTDRLEVTRGNRPAIDWRLHLYEQLQRRLMSEGYTLQTETLVDELKDDPNLCAFVAQKLSAQHPEWSKEFRKQTNPMLKVVRGNVTILETPAGYVMSKAGNDREQLITNFLVKLDQNVWFENSDELWHSGRVVLSGQEFLIKFSRRSSGKGDELEGVASAAVLRSRRQDVKTPVLFDPSHKKHLAAIVSHQVASAPRIEGIRQLGWNTQGTRFTATGWRASALGVEPPPAFQHPGNLLLLRHFTATPVPSGNTISRDEPLALVAVTVAMLARSLKGVEVQPQPVFNNEAGRETLTRLVAVFGQQAPAAPKMNSRAGLRRPFDIDDINGLPIWLDLDPDTASRMVCPSFYLSEAGVELSSTPAFGPASVWIVQSIVQSLLQRPARHAMPAEASWHRLAFEGRQLLQERCSGPWEAIEVDGQAWRRLLWRCGLEKLSDRFQLSGQFIRLNRQDLPRLEQQALLEESLLLDSSVKVEGLDLILPLRLFNQLVEENLGVQPTIERLRPKAGEERLATV